MKKAAVIIPLAIISLLFIIIAFLVFVFRNNKFLIKKKLQTGALIISLTALLSGARCSDARVSCYDVAPARNSITIENIKIDSENNYIMDISSSNIIQFNMKYLYKRDSFHYRLVQIVKDEKYENSEKIIAQGNITNLTVDAQNSELYHFSIAIDKNIKPDHYFLIVTDNNGYDYISLKLIIN